MRKHLIGGAIFVLIVAGFGAILRTARQLHYEVPEREVHIKVESSFLDRATRSFETAVVLTWSGTGPPPERVFVAQRFEVVAPNGTSNYEDVAEIRRPFAGSNTARAVIRLEGIVLDHSRVNVYGRFEAGQSRLSVAGVSSEPAVPVLLIHGESSIPRPR